MITFNCTGYGEGFQVKDQFAGRRTACPKCRKQLRVPGVAHRPDTDIQPSPDPTHLALPIVVSSYIQQNLMPGERLIALSRVHPMVLVAPSIVGALGLLLGVVGIAVGEGSGIVVAALGIPLVLSGGVGASLCP